MIADANDVDSFTKRVCKFQNSSDYTTNPKLQAYFETEWLSCVPMWAAYHRKVYNCTWMHACIQASCLNF